MAFRQQHGLDLDGSRMWFLENHEDCLDSFVVREVQWKYSGRSLGRYLKRERRRMERFRLSCEQWSRRRSPFVYVPEDLVFVALEERNKPGRNVRFAIFRYRADITRALKEYEVWRVMDS